MHHYPFNRIVIGRQNYVILVDVTICNNSILEALAVEGCKQDCFLISPCTRYETEVCEFHAI